MSYTKGRPLCPEEKKLLVSVKHYFDRNKSEFGSSESSAQMTSDALGIGLATVNRVMANYHKDPDSLNVPSPLRGRPSYSVDVSPQEAIRAYIRQANLEGRHITLDTIRDFLQGKSPDESFHLSTLARTLDRWGFEFGKGTRTQHLKEKDYIVVARQHYLRKMRQNRMASDTKVVFKSTRKTGDYHGQMNGDVFQKWFREKLLPNIPRASLIIMDNASYHNMLAEYSAPTPTCSKAKIRSWLEANNIPCKDDCLKVELVDIVRKMAPEPTYTIDVIARQHGHEVIRTPPYHPELQPIETCWGILKNEVARHCDFTLDNLKRQLEHAFDKITATTCQGIIDKVRSVEDRFWEEDAKLDEQQENPIA